MDCRDWDRLVAVLALMVPAVGCAEGSIDEAQFTEDLCDSKGLHALMAVEPDEAVDASALRSAEELFGGEGEELNTSILDADGKVKGLSFSPPLPPALQNCGVSLFGTTFEPGERTELIPVQLQ